jgi:hypothetical protein
MGNRGDSIMSREEINITGLVSCRQGDEVIFENAPNKWVSSGLLSLMAWTQFGYVYGGTYGGWSYYLMPYYGMRIYLGTNTSTATLFSHTALQAPIGTAPGTAANTHTQTIGDGTSTGIWSTTYTATWNAGAITGTVGEMALYLTQNTNTAAAWGWSGNQTAYDVGRAMFSRLAVADSEFTQFTINTAKPLTIDWKVQLSFS